MTTTESPNTAERARRISAYWTHHPTATEDDVVAQVDAELEAEAADRAEQEAKTNAMTDSFKRMTGCGCCRVASAIGARDGLCDACRPVVAAIVAERNGADVVSDGRSRRELAAAYVDRKAAQ